MAVYIEEKNVSFIYIERMTEDETAQVNEDILAICYI